MDDRALLPFTDAIFRETLLSHTLLVTVLIP